MMNAAADFALRKIRRRVGHPPTDSALHLRGTRLLRWRAIMSDRCHSSWLLTLTAGLVIPTAARAAVRPAPPTPAVTVPADIDFRPDLTYGSTADTDLQLDLARPKGLSGPLPVVVYFHGGGWVQGDRKTCLPEVFRTAGAGYVAVTVGYRLAPQSPFPAQIDDARRALRWLRDNAAQYGIDPDRIGVVGYSSGGTLACLLGTDGGPAGVRAVVAYYPATDLARWHRSTAGLPFVERNLARYALGSAFGGTPFQFPGAYAQASPIGRVTRDTAPTLLIHGDADRLIPSEQSDLYRTALERAGVEAREVKLAGVGHNFDETQPALAAEAEAQARGFLDRHLKPQIARR
jgi:acetyl esterase/lipase